MPKIDLRTIAPTELIEKANLLINQIKNEKDFDFKQEITFSNGIKCKPLTLLLGIEEHPSLPLRDKQEIQANTIDVLQNRFQNFNAFRSTILLNLKTLSDYELYEVQSNTVLRGAIHFLQQKTQPTIAQTSASAGNLAGAGAGAVTHGVFAHKTPPSPDDRLLNVERYRGAKGIPFTPEKFLQAIKNDTRCSQYLEPAPGKVLVVNSVTGEPLEAVVDREIQKLKTNDIQRMSMTLVFMPEFGSEILISLQKKDDGSIQAIVTEMMGREKSPVKDQDKFFTSRGVAVLHNPQQLNAIYNGERIYSCCGLMLNRMYRVIDQLKQGKHEMDLEAAAKTLTIIEDPIELKDTIARANLAIQHVIERDMQLNGEARL